MSFSLEDALEHFLTPVLTSPPFPEAITARNHDVLDKLNRWTASEHERVQRDLVRLRERSEAAEDWELATLK